MSLGLDLSNSEAKIARAREHFKALKREVDAVVDERKPYNTVPYHYENSACYALILSAGSFKEPGLGVILGDLIHNLRSALDYIIMALVEASGADLDRQQFPIFDDAQRYSDGAPGMLIGVRFGLREVESIQPFKTANPHHDPLFAINYFSNADKHRVISNYHPILREPLYVGIYPRDGIISQESFTPPDQWYPNTEFRLAKFCYAEPGPALTEVRFKAQISVDIHFGAPPTVKRLVGLAAPTDFFEHCCDHVSMIVDTFKLL